MSVRSDRSQKVGEVDCEFCSVANEATASICGNCGMRLPVLEVGEGDGTLIGSQQRKKPAAGALVRHLTPKENEMLTWGINFVVNQKNKRKLLAAVMFETSSPLIVGRLGITGDELMVELSNLPYKLGSIATTFEKAANRALEDDPKIADQLSKDGYIFYIASQKVDEWIRENP